MSERGKFIVIYGSNNIGKSSQADALEENLRKVGIKASVLKYPIYNLEPTGPWLNDVLRTRRIKADTCRIQTVFAVNRRDYQPTLIKRLDGGEWIVGEDYTGTGIAWGITFGVNRKILEELNYGLFEEDLAICLDGERFLSGIEKNHLHENGGRWESNRKIHQQLSKCYEWSVVNASQSVEKVAQDIWSVVNEAFFIFPDSRL